jgi:mycofactocin system glycosyltransferase
VIPLEYRLRESVRLESVGAGKCRVICVEPLTVLTVNAAAARLLKRARGAATVGDIASGLNVPEERIFSLCEYFRARGILEVRRAAVHSVPGLPVEAGPGSPADVASGLPVDALPGESASSPAAAAPSVTVIIPTLDRAEELEDCLAAVAALDYPRDRLEVVVVDDGSTDAAAVARGADRYRARLFVNGRNRGPSYSRNRAARTSAADILAFVDSDCVPDRSWLRELVPYFAWPRVGAVGGRTLGYYTESSLDRYEEVASSLDMGRHFVINGKGTDAFYVPTCNLLVRRSAYAALGGLREDLHVGEDVDLCWRLRSTGFYLVHAPEGLVRHKHRGRLGAALRRRAQYGTSEAVLHRLHPDKRKRFPLAPAPLASVALVSAALLKREPRLLPLCLCPFLWDGMRRMSRLRRQGVDVPTDAVWRSVLRGHLSMLYFIYFHLTRYHLGPLTVGGTVAPGLWALEGAAVLYSAGVDYSTRRPRLPFSVFLAYYLAEHAAYQAGVIAGCVRSGSFRSYLPAFERRILPGGPVADQAGRVFLR